MYAMARRRCDQKPEGLHPQAESFFLLGHPSSHTRQVIDLGSNMACIVFDGYGDSIMPSSPSPAQAQSASSAIQKCRTCTRKVHGETCLQATDRTSENTGEMQHSGTCCRAPMPDLCARLLFSSVIPPPQGGGISSKPEIPPPLAPIAAPTCTEASGNRTMHMAAGASPDNRLQEIPPPYVLFLWDILHAGARSAKWHVQETMCFHRQSGGGISHMMSFRFEKTLILKAASPKTKFLRRGSTPNEPPLMC